MRVTSFLFVSCRSLTSFPTLHSASSLGTLSPRSSNPVTAASRPLFTPRPRPQRHASHVPRLGPARSTWQNLLLLRRDCLPNRLPQRDRPGRNASPQDLERITVRLPSGIGHGKGPCPATAGLVYPKVFPVTSPAALTDNRSRHPVGPGAQPDPVSSRHDARAISSPFALAEHANLPTVLEKDLQEWSSDRHEHAFGVTDS